MKNLAFSLIELMVVIAIIALLAAIALPAYKAYVTKAKISQGIEVLHGLTERVATIYNQTGSFPTQVDYYGQALTANISGGPGCSIWSGQQPYNNPNLPFIVGGISYMVSADGKAAGFELGFTDLGIPGNSAANLLPYVVRDINGTLVYACGGTSTNNPFSIPMNYLPSGCQCQWVAGQTGDMNIFLNDGLSAC